MLRNVFFVNSMNLVGDASCDVQPTRKNVQLVFRRADDGTFGIGILPFLLSTGMAIPSLSYRLRFWANTFAAAALNVIGLPIFRRVVKVSRWRECNIHWLEASNTNHNMMERSFFNPERLQ